MDFISASLMFNNIQEFMFLGVNNFSDPIPKELGKIESLISLQEISQATCNLQQFDCRSNLGHFLEFIFDHGSNPCHFIDSLSECVLCCFTNILVWEKLPNMFT